MVKTSIKRTIVVVFVIILIVGVCYFVVCDPLSYFNTSFRFRYPEPALQPERGNFRIDSEKILESLDNGNTDVFFPELRQEDELLWTGPALYNKPVQWYQSNFFTVATSLNQFVWNDKLDDWNVYRMIFNLLCQDDPKGFDDSTITFFKLILSNGRMRYATRDFLIFPSYLSVEWRGGADYPHPMMGWKKIDLSKVRINAEVALRIAEENGGKEARLNDNNKCSISLLLYGEFEGWQVSYSLANGSSFDMTIDPSTGKIIKNK